MTPYQTANKRIAVIGAYGHTGKFVVAELIKRGYTPVLAGRNFEKLQAMQKNHPDLEIHQVDTNDSASLDRALEQAVAVINCAGPFLDTAPPVIQAALRTNTHYLDVTAEQYSVQETYDRFSEAAFGKNLVILPAMAFFGGLADLLATHVTEGCEETDTIDIAVSLDSWEPTSGTRETGKRNNYRRSVLANKKLEFVADPPPQRSWNFSGDAGTTEVVGFPLTEVMTISKHIHVRNINTYINTKALNDIHNANTPPPQAADESGRSSQIFEMEVVAIAGDLKKGASVSGRDIYGISGPIIVEALHRIVQGATKTTGVISAGEAFDPVDFLKSMSGAGLRFKELSMGNQ